MSHAAVPPSLGVSYTTIEAVLRQPILFANQQVRLKGEVGIINDSRQLTEGSTTAFHLVDRAGNAIRVETQEQIAVREGHELTVEGKLSVSDLGTSPSLLAVVKEARIVSSASRRERGSAPATAAPAKRNPRLSPAPSGQPTPKNQDNGGRIF
jgi:hypothetical protein